MSAYLFVCVWFHHWSLFYHCVAAFKNKRYDVHQSLTRLFHEKSFSPGPLKRFFFVPRCRQENVYKFFGGFYPPTERLIRPNFQFVRPPPFCAWTIFQRASRREPVDNFRNEIITQQASITCGKEREFVRIFFCLKEGKKNSSFTTNDPKVTGRNVETQIPSNPLLLLLL